MSAERPIPKEAQLAGESRTPDILANYPPEDQKILKDRLRSLDTVGRFIGKDYQMPIELGEAGDGWYWDMRDNEIVADAKDVLEKDLELNRFIIGHEGSHRRISHFDDEFKQRYQTEPGFGIMANYIEDPRVNNYLTDGYPLFEDGLEKSYQDSLVRLSNLELETDAKHGFRPRHLQAGWEYIRQWYREHNNEPFAIDESLPQEVQQVVASTLESAQDVWWSYPTREEANDPELVQQYAQQSAKILSNKVWPEFSKLVEQDVNDQMMQDALQEAADKQANGEPNPFDNLNQQEQEELAQAIAEAIKQSQDDSRNDTPQTQAIPLDKIPDNLKQKIQEHLDNLDEQEAQQRRKQAQKALQQTDDTYNQETESQFMPQAKQDAEPEPPVEPSNQSPEISQPKPPPPIDLSAMHQAMQKIEHQHATEYDQALQEVLPIINKLEAKLNNIFIERQKDQWQSGFSSGKQLDISRRMEEQAKGVSAALTKAWERRELPQKIDYAFSVLVDLSGSMSGGGKIEETFKACIVLTEVLSRLGIPFEVSGFNRSLYKYKSYSQELTKDIRQGMSQMLPEVRSPNAGNNNDGWAVTQQSKSLAGRNEKQKFLIVLSDGQPTPVYPYDAEEYDLDTVVKTISNTTDQHLIGMGLLSKSVEQYYPQHVIASSVEEIPAQLATILEQAINQV